MAEPVRQGGGQHGFEASTESNPSQGAFDPRGPRNTERRVAEERLPVDLIYCFLFSTGYFVVFNPFPLLQSFFPCVTQKAEENNTDSSISCLRGLWCCLHLIPIFVSAAKSWVLPESFTKCYINYLRDLVFLVMRVLPLVMTFLSYNKPSDVDTCSVDDEPCWSWFCRFLLWVVAYQVSLNVQIGLQLCSTLFLEWLYWPQTRWDAFWLFFAGVSPVLIAWLLEVFVEKDRCNPDNGDLKGALPGPSSPGNTATTPETPPRKQRTVASGQEILRVDISRMLAGRQTDGTHTYLDYNSMVSVVTRYIKVKNDAPVTDDDLSRMAKSFAKRLTIRTQTALSSPCSVVKAVAVRGCLLFITEVMVPKSEEPDSQAGTSYKKRNEGESEDLLHCLPDDLQNCPMEIMLDDVKATCVNGKVTDFTDHNCSFLDLEIPDVVLVRPPCVVEDTGSKDTLEVYMSEVKGNWNSLKLVVVVKDSVANEVDLSLPSEDSLKVDVANTEGGSGGYLRTVGVEERLGTFVGGLAPFLMLPAKVAEELNAVFNDIVSWLEGREMTHEQDQKSRHMDKATMEKTAWEKHFKPFALDMTYLLAPDSETLFDMMDRESEAGCNADLEARNNYLQIFLHVADFLETAKAVETEDYLLKRLRNAGVILHCAGKEVAAMSIFPKTPSELPSNKKHILPGIRCEKTTFHVINGFVNPVMEGHYRFHFSRNQVLMDLAGMTMGLCLLPVISVVGEKGRCLYLCPLVMHLRLSLVCWVMSRGTYISNREPIVMLSWGVRTVAWLGYSLNQKSFLGGPFMSWPALSFLVWTIFVKPQVLKVPFSMHVVLGSIDTLVGIIGLVLGTWCEDWRVIIQGPAVLLTGLLVSIPVVYISEKRDRERFQITGLLAKG